MIGDAEIPKRDDSRRGGDEESRVQRRECKIGTATLECEGDSGNLRGCAEVPDVGASVRADGGETRSVGVKAAALERVEIAGGAVGMKGQHRVCREQRVDVPHPQLQPCRAAGQQVAAGGGRHGDAIDCSSMALQRDQRSHIICRRRRPQVRLALLL